MSSTDSSSARAPDDEALPLRGALPLLSSSCISLYSRRCKNGGGVRCPWSALARATGEAGVALVVLPMLSLCVLLRVPKGTAGGAKEKPDCSNVGLPSTMGLSEPSRIASASAESSSSGCSKRGGEGEVLRGKMG